MPVHPATSRGQAAVETAQNEQSPRPDRARTLNTTDTREKPHK
jgi:hypothetical protein